MVELRKAVDYSDSKQRGEENHVSRETHVLTDADYRLVAKADCRADRGLLRCSSNLDIATPPAPNDTNLRTQKLGKLRFRQT